MYLDMKINTTVYKKLKRFSENHIRTFYRFLICRYQYICIGTDWPNGATAEEYIVHKRLDILMSKKPVAVGIRSRQDA